MWVTEGVVPPELRGSRRRLMQGQAAVSQPVVRMEKRFRAEATQDREVAGLCLPAPVRRTAPAAPGSRPGAAAFSAHRGMGA